MNNLDTKFEYQRISKEEQEQRGILGRLAGRIASWKEATRNGRRYGRQLWENVLKDPIFREKIETKSCYGQLEHPVGEDQSTDPNKICICLAELPKIMDDGYVYGVFDIVNTPMGQILKTMLDYGTTIGVSSRGSGDLFTDYDGQESVDPDTYECLCWDCCALPALKSARMSQVNESLGTKKTLKEALDELVQNADEKDKAVMQSAIDSLATKEEEASEESSEEKPEEKKITARVLDDSTLERPIKQELDANKLIRLSKEKDSSIDKLPDAMGYLVTLRGKDLDNKELQDYLESFACVTFDESNSDSTVKTYKCNCKLNFLESAESEQQTIDEIKALVSGGDDDVQISKEEIDLDEVPEEEIPEEKISGPVDKDKLNEICENIALQIEDIELTADEFNKIVKYLVNKFTPSEEDEGSYVFVEPLQPEEEDSNNADQEEVGNAKSEDSDIIEQLSEALQREHGLKQQVVELNEKLSVCYAKESLNEEQTSKYKKAISNLTTNSNKVPKLESRVSTLNETLEETKKALDFSNEQLAEASTSLNESKAVITKLKKDRMETKDIIKNLNEELSSRSREMSELSESFSAKEDSLNETISKLSGQLEATHTDLSEKLQKSQAMVEKYKKIATNAVDKYIQNKAVQIGVSTNEIKNKLPESYNFDDINQICEDLQDQKLNLNKLPFRATSGLNESVKVAVKPSTAKSLMPTEQSSFDDTIDGWLSDYVGRR